MAKPHVLTTARYAQYAQSIVDLIDDVFAKNPDEGMTGRIGAYFCVTEEGISIAGGLVGAVESLEKRTRYDRLSREKPARTFCHRSLGHRTSRESADPAQEKYTGAVAGKKREYGFSGYLADVDEIGSALLAFYCDDLTLVEAGEILEQNPYYKLLRPHFIRTGL